MPRVIAPEVWDAIERRAAELGGVGRGSTTVGPDRQPWCAWGIAHEKGVSGLLTSDRIYGIFEWDQQVLPSFTELDHAHWTINPSSEARVPWPELAAAAGLVRGSDV